MFELLETNGFLVVLLCIGSIATLLAVSAVLIGGPWASRNTRRKNQQQGDELEEVI